MASSDVNGSPWTLLAWLIYNAVFLGLYARLSAEDFRERVTRVATRSYATAWLCVLAPTTVGIWIVFASDDGGFAAVVLYVLQVFPALAMGYLYHRLDLFRAAFIVGAVFWALLSAMLVLFFLVSTLAGVLALPYFAWISFLILVVLLPRARDSGLPRTRGRRAAMREPDDRPDDVVMQPIGSGAAGTSRAPGSGAAGTSRSVSLLASYPQPKTAPSGDEFAPIVDRKGKSKVISPGYGSDGSSTPYRAMPDGGGTRRSSTASRSSTATSSPDWMDPILSQAIDMGSGEGNVPVLLPDRPVAVAPPGPLRLLPRSDDAAEGEEEEEEEDQDGESTDDGSGDALI